jgi:Peptidase dimerisation domain
VIFSEPSLLPLITKAVVSPLRAFWRNARPSDPIMCSAALRLSKLARTTDSSSDAITRQANRGAITLRVDVQGHAAHVGQAHLGVNAFERKVRIAEPLTALAQELPQRRTDYPLESDEARGSMLVVSGASGSGASFNVVPGAAWFSIDRRFNLSPASRPTSLDSG